jgi:hypothetical protein
VKDDGNSAAAMLALDAFVMLAASQQERAGETIDEGVSRTTGENA